MIKVNCNLCGRDDYRVRFPATAEGDSLHVDAFRCTNPGYGSHGRIVECRHCGLVYTNPRWPAGDVMDAYSAVQDEVYIEERLGREMTFRHHLHSMERITGPADGRALLDVGAYIGVFVEMAGEAGWRAQGVEPSAWAAAEARRRGLDVRMGTMELPELAEESFDVITLWDVIEHFTDPAAELERARRLLKPGGWLVVHTMDIDAPIARLMGGRWPWLMDMHLYFFSARTLGRMLREHGYEVAWQGAEGRYLSLGYLASRVEGMQSGVGRLVRSFVGALKLQHKEVGVNFGDLRTFISRRVV